MPRNLFERCEVVFPIRDAQIGTRIRNEILAALLADQLKTRALNASGVYQRISKLDTQRGRPLFSAQDFFIQVAEGKASQENIPPTMARKLASASAAKRRKRKYAAKT